MMSSVLASMTLSDQEGILVNEWQRWLELWVWSLSKRLGLEVPVTAMRVARLLRGEDQRCENVQRTRGGERGSHERGQRKKASGKGRTRRGPCHGREGNRGVVPSSVGLGIWP